MVKKKIIINSCVNLSKTDLNAYSTILSCWQQGFETQTGPYGPTGKTSNRSFLQFF